MTTIDYAGLFDAMPTPQVIMDRDFRLVAMNQAYLDVTQRTREDLTGKTMFEAFPEGAERMEMLRRSIARARDEGVVDHLAFIPYEIPVDGGTELRFWSATHIPIRDDKGRVVAVLQQTQDVTELMRLREAARAPDSALAQDVMTRAAAVQMANASLAQESEQLKRLFNQAPSFMAVLRGPDHVFELVNEAYQTVVGRSDLVGRPLRAALPEIEGQGFIDVLDRVRATGTPYVGANVAVTLTRKGRAEERNLTFVYQPLFDETGGVSGIFVEGFDITDRVRAEAQLRLLVDELNHRVKNTLASVQAIAMQTMHERARDPYPTFAARLASLARTHGALTREHWSGAALSDLAKSETDAYGPGRVKLAGPDVHLRPRPALALGLVFHELATNAAKYGALSAPDGRVDVSWRVEDQPYVRLFVTWREMKGPAPKQNGEGFGTKLIRRSIAGELEGEAQFEFAPEGLTCRLVIPLEPPHP
ncbi:MAG: sensor histidine kinase [Hyphomonadaceae bacterium]